MLPRRKSIANRRLPIVGVSGDYVSDDAMLPKIVEGIMAHELDLEARRDPNIPGAVLLCCVFVCAHGRAADPEAQRLWDTKCSVLGRGVLVARSRLKQAGFGLFATRDFEGAYGPPVSLSSHFLGSPAGALVTEYTGPLIDNARARELRAQGERARIFFFSLLTRMRSRERSVYPLTQKRLLYRWESSSGIGRRLRPNGQRWVALQHAQQLRVCRGSLARCCGCASAAGLDD